jgi:arsenate reductase (thioredoxin)
MTHRSFNVLFLCTANSARSILAEAILNKIGNGRFRAFSAGSQPRGMVHPYTLSLLEHSGFDTGFARSKSWEEFAASDAPVMDFVFTVCDNAANEQCPVWPGQPMTAHWGVPDPAVAFADAFRMLSNRISVFTALPFASLDRLSIQRQIQAIGRSSADDTLRAS